MRRKRLTLHIFLWGMLAALVPVGLLFLFLWSSGAYFAPALCAGLILILFCIYKIHFLLRSRSHYIRGDWSLTDLDDISGTDFEALTCDILASNGFELAQKIAVISALMSLRTAMEFLSRSSANATITMSGSKPCSKSMPDVLSMNVTLLWF